MNGLSKETSMTFSTKISIFLMLLLSLGGIKVFAQFSSGIEGTVQDQSGAILPGAKVTITDTRLGIERTVTSNQAGYFRIDSIAASDYTVIIEVAGFKKYE